MTSHLALIVRVTLLIPLLADTCPMTSTSNGFGPSRPGRSTTAQCCSLIGGGEGKHNQRWSPPTCDLHRQIRKERLCLIGLKACYTFAAFLHATWDGRELWKGPERDEQLAFESMAARQGSCPMRMLASRLKQVSGGTCSQPAARWNYNVSPWEKPK